MKLFKSKSAPKEPVYLLCYRAIRQEPWEEPAGREAAFAAFAGCVQMRKITPFNGRRLLLAGPDYCVQPDDHDDPLLIGAAAVRAVLTPAEFEAHARQTAEYALVST
jgi:hypothetical protein